MEQEPLTASPQETPLEDRGGWIKLYRSSVENGWLSNHKLWAFWCWCLLKATHKEYKTFVGNERVTLLPGQFIFTRRKAAKELKISEQQTRTCIDSLRSAKNLTLRATHRYSVVTIVNWGLYQQSENGNNPPSNPVSTQSQPIYKNIKKEKNTAPGFQPILEFYLSKAEESKGFKPELPKKDFSLLSKTLKKHGPERVKNIILFFLNSEKSESHVSLTSALSADTINQYNLKWQKAKFQYGDNAEQPTGEEVWW